jgi:iron complex outermembrane receptor protein
MIQRRRDLCLAVGLAGLSSLAFGASTVRDESAERRLPEVSVEAESPPPLERPSTAGGRLGLTLRETPASVDIIDQEALRARGETTFVEAFDNVPGLSTGACFGVFCISARGFSSSLAFPILFDGLRYPGLATTPRVTLNYERLEVLRGPASLLAGSGAVGGALNVVPYRADGRETTQLYAAWGRFGTSTLGVGRGGAVAGDAVRYRVDLAWQGSDERGSFGYADRTSFAFRHAAGELAFPLADTLLLTVGGEVYADDAEGYFGTPLVLGRIDESLRTANYNVIDDLIDKRVRWARARLDWTPSTTFRAALQAWENSEDRDWRNTEAYTFRAATGDVARTDWLQIHHDQGQRGAIADFAWETSLFGLPHRLAGGLEAWHNDHTRTTNSPFRFTDVVALRDPALGVFRSLDAFLPFVDTDVDQRSAFVESRLTVVDGVNLVTGFRYDDTDVDARALRTNTGFSKSYHSRSWRAGLLWDVVERGTLYASASAATEPPTQIVTLTQANAPFDLTESDQVEIGFKQTFRTGEWTVALYDIARTNILTRDPVNPNLTQQIGEQSARGIEVSLGIALAPAWRVDLAASVLDAQFDDFNDRVGNTVVSREGLLPPDVPERVASGWLTWAPADTWRIGLGTRYVGERTSNNANTLFLPSYAVWDAHGSLDTGWGTFGLRVRNLGDKVYANRSYNGGNQAVLGEPRFFEVNWRYRF